MAKVVAQAAFVLAVVLGWVGPADSTIGPPRISTGGRTVPRGSEILLSGVFWGATERQGGGGCSSDRETVSFEDTTVRLTLWSAESVEDVGLPVGSLRLRSDQNGSWEFAVPIPRDFSVGPATLYAVGAPDRAPAVAHTASIVLTILP
jgi:hypothetical protein